MAASGDRDRKSRGYVYLAGHALLVLGFVFFTVGFATDHWLTTGDTHFGLWEMCVGQLCDTASPGDYAAWMEATRAMQTMALMCYMLGALAGLISHCIANTFLKPSTTSANLREKSKSLLLFTILGSFFCVIGVAVYGGKGGKEGTLGYSYGLTVFSLFLCVIGAVMVFITINDDTSHTRVIPQEQHPQNVSGVSYPYGQGQFGNPGDGGGSYPCEPSNASRRLPPISEVTPSAPPPPQAPPANGDQPPSYLEAVGHGHP
ncbi:lens fiber membrane intrinsic protein-like isoform X1 [Babylonia areolata]|uniref:lens fiber membrane intrinsic protein-like isoform X1 n=1 Tax=Babylonia areolata TaxID=304850 RepID=UPI003FD1CB1B